MIKVGDVFDGYAIVKHLNDGGMSSVWLVEKDKMHYALKVCEKLEPEFIKRFDREFRLMQCLDHINVLKAFFKGEIDGKPYIVIEKGDYSLKDAVEKGLTIKQKFELVLQVCDGLSYVHNNGEAHRDIKPENILIVNGVAKIADFGISRFINRDTTTLTTTTERYSSWGYMAPEILEDGAFRDCGTSIDIYALGSLAYYVFSDGSLPAFFSYKQVLADIYPVLAKCRENDVDERYQTVDEVRYAINNVIAARSRYKSLSELLQDSSNLTPSEISENAIPLLLKSNGIGELIENFNIFKSMWSIIYKVVPTSVDSIITFIIDTFNRDCNYYIQFQDTETIACMAVLLCPLTNVPDFKIALFDLALTNAINANRWDALRNIYNNIILKWDKDTILPYTTYIHDNKEKLSMLSQAIDVKIPSIVTNYY